MLAFVVPDRSKDVVKRANERPPEGGEGGKEGREGAKVGFKVLHFTLSSAGRHAEGEREGGREGVLPCVDGAGGLELVEHVQVAHHVVVQCCVKMCVFMGG